MRALRPFLALALACFTLTSALPAWATYLPSSGSSYVAGFTPSAPGLLANLLANAPCSASYLGQYATISDLYGGTNEVLRCGYTSGFGYYWRPQRTDYEAAKSVSTATASLAPLVDAPLIMLTCSVTCSISPSATNAWPGECFEVENTSTIGGLIMTITGLLSASQIVTALGVKRVCYTGSGYQAF